MLIVSVVRGSSSLEGACSLEGAGPSSPLPRRPTRGQRGTQRSNRGGEASWVIGCRIAQQPEEGPYPKTQRILVVLPPGEQPLPRDGERIEGPRGLLRGAEAGEGQWLGLINDRVE